MNQNLNSKQTINLTSSIILARKGANNSPKLKNKTLYHHNKIIKKLRNNLVKGLYNYRSTHWRQQACNNNRTQKSSFWFN